MKLLAVFIGGGLGSLARYELSLYIGSGAINWSTFLSNLFSSFLLGIIINLIPENEKSSTTYLLVAIGFCGGFSTFSTFSLENFMLFKNAHYNLLFLNIAINVILCFVGVFLGYKILKWS